MFLIFSAILLLCAVAEAEKGSFTIPLIRQKTPRQVAINLKNSGYLAPKPSNATNDTVALYRYMDAEFYGVIQIGKKARPFNLALDTSWGYSWVISEDCAYMTVGCWFHNKYDHTKSSTYVENGTEINIPIGKDKYSGYFSQDNFHLEQLDVTNQTFIEMVQVPPLFALSKIDGVIGLGYSSLSNGVTPVFYNLVKQHKMKSRVFTIYMNRDKSSNRGGDITFGRINEKHILKNQSTIYLPINQTGYWQFKMDQIIMVDGIRTFTFCVRGCQTIIDTSSNNILGPAVEIRKINRLIKAKYVAYGRYRVKCDTINKLPKISFSIGGRDNFTLTGKDYVEEISYESFTLCLSAFLPSGSDDQNLWVLGGAFLAQYYTIYDLDRNQIGFVN